MVNSRQIIDVMIICSLPFQFSFELNFYGTASSKIQENWDMTKISDFQIRVSDKITTYTAAICALLSIVFSYKVKKRRLPICCFYIFSGIIWICFLMISDNVYWLVILLRCLCGVLLGFFQSVHISYMMHFVEKEHQAFNGCMVQFSMFLSLILVEILVYCVSWKVICAIIALQSFLFAGFIWIVPEVPIPIKGANTKQVYHQPNLKYLLVMMGVMLLQGFSGIGFMIDNTTRLMSGIGIQIDTTLQSALTNFIGCLSCFISAFIMDIAGVRVMWAFSCAGVIISLIMYAITLKLDTPNWLGALSVFLYFLFYGLGEGPIPWLLCGVLFPENVMLETGGINCFMNRFLDIWFGAYVISNITKAFGEFGSIFFNVCCSIITALFGFFLIPPTKKTDDFSLSLL